MRSKILPIQSLAFYSVLNPPPPPAAPHSRTTGFQLLQQNKMGPLFFFELPTA